MGYNKNDYIKVKKDFENKYLIARGRAEQRQIEIHSRIPDIRDIDRTLAHTGMDIMAVITSGAKNHDEEIAKLEARNNELVKKRTELLRAYGYPENYTDVVYECEKCGDTGYLDTRMCDCMKRALIKEAYASSGLGCLIGTQTFDNFEYRYYKETMKPMVKDYVTELKRFSQTFSNDTYENYLFLGSTGLGKTHLSAAVAQTVIDKGFDVFYTGAIGMIGDFEAQRFGNGRKRNDTERYYDCDLLIIDDLGAEVVNKFTHADLYDVVNTRMNNRKCTIISTNLTPAELNLTYTERLSSRIMGEYIPMYFDGDDIRKLKSILK